MRSSLLPITAAEFLELTLRLSATEPALSQEDVILETLSTVGNQTIFELI
jgi:hypothetical protein